MKSPVLHRALRFHRDLALYAIFYNFGNIIDFSTIAPIIMRHSILIPGRIIAYILLCCSIAVNAQVEVSYSKDNRGIKLFGNGESAAVVVSPKDFITVKKAAQLLAGDMLRAGAENAEAVVTDTPDSRHAVIAGTVGHSRLIDDMIRNGKLDANPIVNGHEQYILSIVENPLPGVKKALVIAGSDRRGTAYGLLSVSEGIGVSPWYWWADVPIKAHKEAWASGNYVSPAPSVKYRGFFINDEDWGLKPWSTYNYEKELGDIGPKTYARVCELLLRLRGNMLAPAMHSCTGAFYSHPESKLVADTFGIIITTSHCEPLLLNNAALSEWDSKRDGSWDYLTNSKTIRDKWENRLNEAACYENIYTMAMRGVHDAGLVTEIPIDEKVTLIQQVIGDQREMLTRHTGKPITEIPQIFVPYKETMDIYDNGLKVPDDITIVWVDDNYGYFKKVSNDDERKRSGGAGVYYHLSYLGAPHDYLWICTTPPVLMYEELKKTYDTGADRYWLLNVGDIKPMELGIQTFFEMAFDFDNFDVRKVNEHQVKFLASIFGTKYEKEFKYILDNYYRLAWSRKPEFMGFECEWDDAAHTGLRDTDFSFDNYNEARQRLADYRRISDMADSITDSLDPQLKNAFFEMLAFPVKGAYQMNRKFLMAQLNHELLAKNDAAGANRAARETDIAYDSIQTLINEYNSLLDGKWKGMMDLAPAFCALYQNKPVVTVTPGAGERDLNIEPVETQSGTDRCMVLNLSDYDFATGASGHNINIVKGIGYDGYVIKLGEPTTPVADPTDLSGAKIVYSLPAFSTDSIDVYVDAVPLWPLHDGRSTRIGVAVDDSVKVFENKFKEYSREWKDQVLRNGVVKHFRFAVDKNKPSHKLSLICGDPGMMVQKIIIDWGGLKKSYIGPAAPGRDTGMSE